MFYTPLLRGLLPRLTSRALADGFAEEALNCNLMHGRLEAWNGAVTIESTANAVDFLQLEDGTFIYFDTPTDAVRYSVYEDEVYILEQGGELFMASADLLKIRVKIPMTVPRPMNPPDIDRYVDTQGTSDGREHRNYYFYTYVDEMGSESPPSPMALVQQSEATTFRHTLQFRDTPDWVRTVRVWRADTGYRSGQEQEAVADTEFHLVGSVTNTGNSIFFDNDDEPVSMGLQFDPLEHIRHPIDIKNIGLTDSGHLIGSSGKIVHIGHAITTRAIPHSWPGTLDIQLDDEIVKILPVGNIVYVITTGKPVMLRYDPSSGSFLERVAAVSMPCNSRSSVVFAGDKVIYTSEEGLVQVTPPGRDNSFQATIMSNSYWSPMQWKAIKSEDSQGFYAHGLYFMLLNGTGYAIPTGSSIHGQPSELLPLTEFDIVPKSRKIYTDDKGQVYYLSSTSLHMWNVTSEESPVPFSYLSRIHTEKSRLNYGAAQVVTEGNGSVDFALFSITDDRSRMRMLRAVTKHTFRMPRNYRSREFQFRLQGTKPVNYVHLSGNIIDLTTEQRQ